MNAIATTPQKNHYKHRRQEESIPLPAMPFPALPKYRFWESSHHCSWVCTSARLCEVQRLENEGRDGGMGIVYEMCIPVCQLEVISLLTLSCVACWTVVRIAVGKTKRKYAVDTRLVKLPWHYHVLYCVVLSLELKSLVRWNQSYLINTSKGYMQIMKSASSSHSSNMSRTPFP